MRGQRHSGLSGWLKADSAEVIGGCFLEAAFQFSSIYFCPQMKKVNLSGREAGIQLFLTFIIRVRSVSQPLRACNVAGIGSNPIACRLQPGVVTCPEGRLPDHHLVQQGIVESTSKDICKHRGVRSQN